MFLASYSWRMCQSMFIRRPLWWFWCTALFHWKETTNFLLLQSLSRCFILLSSVWMFKESSPPQSPKMGKPTFRLVKFDMFCWGWLGRCDAGNCRCKEHLETSNFQGRARLRGETKELRFSMGEGAGWSSYKIDLPNNPDLCMNLNHVNLWFWLVCFFERIFGLDFGGVFDIFVVLSSALVVTNVFGDVMS